MVNIKPSSWIVNGLSSLYKYKNKIDILDLACGDGRHSIYASNKNHSVVAVDKNFEKLKNFSNYSNIKIICFDLENDDKWPINQKFDVVIVVNYLYRKNFNKILNLVKLGGHLIYETFAQGNEVYGKPNNPSFLLKTNELKILLDKDFELIKFKHGIERFPKISIKQKCIAKRVASSEATRSNI